MAFHHFVCCFLLLILIVHASFGDYRDEEEFQCHILYEFNATESNPSGDVYSPFYGERNYPDGLWCEYRITAPEGYRLKLTFKDIDIDPSDFCGQDKLIIYAKEKEWRIASICGTDPPDPLITDPGVNMVHFLFQTDFMSAGKGFHVHYEASPTFAYCSPELKECGNRKCFDPKTQRCDGVDNCGDGTDEEECNLPLAISECGDPPIKPDTIYGLSPDRIIGGQEVIPGSWPWQVSLQNRDTFASHSCGGSLINAQWVVTAAHCFKGNPYAENWRIHAGKHHKYFKDTSEQVRYGQRIIIWPDKTGDTLVGSIDMNHDIALIKLNAPVQFTDSVRPVCLPSLGWDLKPGSLCYVTGWGETRGTGFNHVLKQTDVSFMDPSNCTGYQPSSQICVKNQRGFQSTCHGDSGGPLVCKLGGKWYVMGATSYGTLSNFQTGLCAMPNQRTVFMKMSDKAHWIQSMIDMYT